MRKNRARLLRKQRAETAAETAGACCAETAGTMLTTYFSPFIELISVNLQKNWNTFSLFIAGICFYAVMSTDPDSKNPKVSPTPIHQSLWTLSLTFRYIVLFQRFEFLMIFQATRTAAVALIMSILWIMAPIPGK